MATKKKATPAQKAAKKPAKKSATSKSIKSTVEARAAALPSSSAEANPSEPVSTLAALALRTAELATPAFAQLKKLAGFEAVWLSDLRPGVQLMSAAEAVWSAARAQSRAGVAPARVKAAEALKSELVEAGRYLLRNDPVVQEQLDQIRAGTGVADLAADLRALSELAATHGPAFADGGVDKNAAAAATLAAELTTGIDPADAAELQARRNRLFHLVQSDCRELRAALRFLWRKQPTKLAVLGPTYASQLRKERATKKKQTTTTPA